MAPKYAPGIRIDHEDRQVASVKQNGICGFFTHTAKGQELLPKLAPARCGVAMARKHPSQGTGVACVKIPDKSFECT